jgi:hypothetical protein
LQDVLLKECRFYIRKRSIKDSDVWLFNSFGVPKKHNELVNNYEVSHCQSANVITGTNGTWQLTINSFD